MPNTCLTVSTRLKVSTQPRPWSSHSHMPQCSLSCLYSGSCEHGTSLLSLLNSEQICGALMCMASWVASLSIQHWPRVHCYKLWWSGTVNPTLSVCFMEINRNSSQHSTSHGPGFVLTTPHGTVMWSESIRRRPEPMVPRKTARHGEEPFQDSGR